MANHRQAILGGAGFDFPEGIVALANGGWFVGCTPSSEPSAYKTVACLGVNALVGLTSFQDPCRNFMFELRLNGLTDRTL